MNRDQFEKAMSDLDEKIVAEAAGYKKPALRGKIIKIGSLAACAVLVLVGVAGMFSNGMAADNAKSQGISDPNAGYYSEGKEFASGEEPKSDGRNVINEDNALTPEGLTPNKSGQIDYAGENEVITAGPSAIDPSRIIYTAKLTLESKDFEKSFADVEKIVADLGGYFEDQSVYDQGASIRRATMTIRVPKEQYQSALEQIKAVAHVTFSNQSAENVSKEYYDIETRLNTARIKLERLQGLLAEAEMMTDIIDLENAISNVEWEIDYYSGSLKEYDSLIDYSTIQVELMEVQELTDTTPEPISFGARLKNAFVYGFENIGDSLVTFVEWFVGNIFWIALIVVAVIIAVKVIKKKRRAI